MGHDGTEHKHTYPRFVLIPHVPSISLNQSCRERGCPIFEFAFFWTQNHSEPMSLRLFFLLFLLLLILTAVKTHDSWSTNGSWLTKNEPSACSSCNIQRPRANNALDRSWSFNRIISQHYEPLATGRESMNHFNTATRDAKTPWPSFSFSSFFFHLKKHGQDMAEEPPKKGFLYVSMGFCIEAAPKGRDSHRPSAPEVCCRSGSIFSMVISPQKIRRWFIHWICRL